MALIVSEVLSQHVEEAGSLFETRGPALEAPHVRLRDLRRGFDDRLAAHFDGLSIAGEHVWSYCEAALEEPSAGAVFTAAVQALEDRRTDRLEKLLGLIGALPDIRSAFVAACGWVEPDRLQNTGAALLRSSDPLKRVVGIGACSVHRIDPGLVSGPWFADVDLPVRAAAVRLVGEVGCGQAIQACSGALNGADAECRFFAAWSSVLLGNRGVARELLTEVALTEGLHQTEALRLAIQAMSPSEAHRVLQELAEKIADKRRLIESSGVAGDPRYLTWLLEQMSDIELARLAGSAFSLITGVDLVGVGFDAKRPSGAETGPNENPEDPTVQMDPDEGLPWPDVEKLQDWWTKNGSRFQPGSRYFMGAPVTREHCIQVLKDGYQRQRILAAHYLCLLEPGTPLFNTSAPAWRQQKLLAQMA